MSKTFKIVANENTITEGPKFELRSGNKSRNETDRDLLPPTVPGWPKNKTVSETKTVEIKENKLATDYRDLLVSNSDSATTEETSDSEKNENTTEFFVETELERSFKNLKMSTTHLFRRSEEHEKHELDHDHDHGTTGMLPQTELSARARMLEAIQNSNQPQTGPQTDEIDEKKAIAMAKSIFSVSDTVIAPRPFTGNTAESDAESWLEFFELYCKHRGLVPSEKLTLFPLMMRGGAADWLATLPIQRLQHHTRTMAAAYTGDDVDSSTS